MGYIVSFLCISYTLIRCQFLYKLRINFLNFSLLCCRISLDEFKKSLSIDYCMDCIYCFEKMFFYFWKWDIHSMVQNKKRWNEVIFFGNYQNNRLTYKPFKLRI